MTQQLRGSLDIQQQGIIVVISDFSNEAKKEAEAPSKTRINLVNIDQLAKLLIQYIIGEKNEQHISILLDD